MRVDLKAKQARKRKRPLDLRHRNTTLVDIEQMLVETLNTHLILVQPVQRISVRVCGVTASGRVSITSPTTRCFAVSLMRC